MGDGRARNDGRIRTDLKDGEVMENGMKNQTTSADRAYGRSTIYGKDGEHKTPYMTRWWIGRLRLHIFYRGDNDPDPHDHPWGFWTFPLTPYVEEVIEPHVADAGRRHTIARVFKPEWDRKLQVVPAFRWSYRQATHTHRVLGRFDPANTKFDTKTGEVAEPTWRTGKIVTIVWRGPDERRWGFLKYRDGRWCWTHWKEYVYGTGKSAPCE